jgi:FMN phosphatase YigB (HAD superfamily)
MTQSPLAQHIVAVCFDFGDTLADEATEIKDATMTTVTADLIPGAGEVVRELKQRGYKLALVADGRPGTYYNVLSQHRLYDLFDAFTISEEIGALKPAAVMFTHALDQLAIAREDYGRTIMVGNSLERDVQGANRVGMISVWLDWAPRRSKVPANRWQIPDHTIKQPGDLLALMALLEAQKADG